MDDMDPVIAAAFIAHHLAREHPPAQPPKPPTFRMPQIKMGVYASEWQEFKRQWDVYKDSANVPATKASAYLLNCCAPDLMSTVQKEDPDITEKAVNDVLNAIKRLAVVEVVTCVMRTELFSMTQEHEEPVRTFAARAKGLARNCKFSKKCTCDLDVDFSDNVVKVIVTGKLVNETS